VATFRAKRRVRARRPAEGDAAAGAEQLARPRLQIDWEELRDAPSSWCAPAGFGKTR
jgi:hypothetical protein